MITRIIKLATGADWPVILMRSAGYLVCFVVAAAPGWFVRGWYDASDVAEARADLARALQGVADAEVSRVTTTRREKEADAVVARAEARFLEDQIQRSEAARAQLQSQLRASLRQPLVCRDGMALADVVLPAAAVDGLRNAGTAALNGQHPPGPAASQPGG